LNVYNGQVANIAIATSLTNLTNITIGETINIYLNITDSFSNCISLAGLTPFTYMLSNSTFVIDGGYLSYDS